jgi:hypothetical protein
MYNLGAILDSVDKQGFGFGRLSDKTSDRLSTFLLPNLSNSQGEFSDKIYIFKGAMVSPRVTSPCVFLPRMNTSPNYLNI